jgi:hypothetical protein
MMNATVMVRRRFEGFHQWPDATGQRDYLAHRHRHLFWVQVEAAVTHDDREIEFHDLLDQVKAWWPGPELGRWSCEQIGKHYLNHLIQDYGHRSYLVEVWEDGEVGARVTWQPGNEKAGPESPAGSSWERR